MFWLLIDAHQLLTKILYLLFFQFLEKEKKNVLLQFPFMVSVLWGVIHTINIFKTCFLNVLNVFCVLDDWSDITLLNHTNFKRYLEQNSFIINYKFPKYHSY